MNWKARCDVYEGTTGLPVCGSVSATAWPVRRLRFTSIAWSLPSPLTPPCGSPTTVKVSNVPSRVGLVRLYGACASGASANEPFGSPLTAS